MPPHLDGPELRALPRNEVERGMEFMGFAVFQVGRTAAWWKHGLHVPAREGE
jgi:hypothetical protein